MEEKLVRLYEYLNATGNYTGSRTSFQTELGNEDFRKQVYGWVKDKSKKGVTYDEFNTRMFGGMDNSNPVAPKKKDSTSTTSSNQSNDSNNLESEIPSTSKPTFEKGKVQTYDTSKTIPTPNLEDINLPQGLGEKWAEEAKLKSGAEPYRDVFDLEEKKELTKEEQIALRDSEKKQEKVVNQQLSINRLQGFGKLPDDAIEYYQKTNPIDDYQKESINRNELSKARYEESAILQQQEDLQNYYNYVENHVKDAHGDVFRQMDDLVKELNKATVNYNNAKTKEEQEAIKSGIDYLDGKLKELQSLEGVQKLAEVQEKINGSYEQFKTYLDKYPDAKKQLLLREQEQAEADEDYANANKIGRATYNVYRNFSKASGKMLFGLLSLPRTVKTAVGGTEYGRIDQLADWANDTNEKLQEEWTPTPIQLQRGLVENVVKHNGLEYIVDEKTGDLLSVRDKGRPVEVTQAMSQEFEEKGLALEAKRKFNSQTLFSKGTETLFDLMMMGGVAKGGGLIKSGTKFAEKTANARLVTAITAQMHNDAYGEALANGLNTEQAGQYALATSVGVGLLAVSLGGVEKMMVAPGGFRQAALKTQSGVLRQNAVALARGEVTSLSREVLKRNAKNFVKEGLKEGAEEAIFEKALEEGTQMLFNATTNSNFDIGFSKNEALEAAILSIPLGMLGGEVTSKANVHKEAIVQISQNADKYKELVDYNVQNGLLTEEEGKYEKERVDVLAANQNALRQKKLTDAEKIEVINLVDDKFTLEHKKKNSKVDAAIQDTDTQIEKINERIQAIVNKQPKEGKGKKNKKGDTETPVLPPVSTVETPTPETTQNPNAPIPQGNVPGLNPTPNPNVEPNTEGNNPNIEPVSNPDTPVPNVEPIEVEPNVEPSSEPMETPKPKGFYEQARKDGEYEEDGNVYKRRGKILKKVEGNTRPVNFSKKDAPLAKFTIIEADDLVPSHKNGIRNREHFIPEAQPRNRGRNQNLKTAGKEKADNLDPYQLGQSPVAYTGTPVVNQRGEVIQGNGRGEAIKIYYDSYPNDDKGYRAFLESEAQGLGIDPEQLGNFNNPVLVRMVDTGDVESIRLGNFTQSDLEDAKNKIEEGAAMAGRLTEEQAVAIADLIVKEDDGHNTLIQMIRKAGKPLVRKLQELGVIRNDAIEDYIDSKGHLKEKAIKEISLTFVGLMLKDGHPDLTDLFTKISKRISIALEKASPSILKVPRDKGLIEDVQQAIIAIYSLELSNLDFNTWSNQGDLFLNGTPKLLLTPSQLTLVEFLSSAEKQSEITEAFSKLADAVLPQKADLFGNEREGYGKDESIKKIFSRGTGKNPRREQKAPPTETEGKAEIKQEQDTISYKGHDYIVTHKDGKIVSVTTSKGVPTKSKGALAAAKAFVDTKASKENKGSKGAKGGTNTEPPKQKAKPKQQPKTPKATKSEPKSEPTKEVPRREDYIKVGNTQYRVVHNGVRVFAVITKGNKRSTSPKALKAAISFVKGFTKDMEGDGRKVTVLEMLDYADTSSFAAFSDSMGLSDTYNFLFKIADDLGIKLKINTEKSSTGGKYVFHEFGYKEIKVNKKSSKIAASKQDVGYLEEVLAHEIIHGIIFNKFRNNANDYQASQLKADLKELWDKLKLIYRMTDVNSLDKEVQDVLYNLFGKGGTYSRTNKEVFGYEQELVTWGLTNTAFAKWLNSLDVNGEKAKSDTIWEKLKNIILQLIKPSVNKTQLDVLTELVDKHLDIKFKGDVVGSSPNIPKGSSLIINPMNGVVDVADFFSSVKESLKDVQDYVLGTKDGVKRLREFPRKAWNRWMIAKNNLPKPIYEALLNGNRKLASRISKMEFTMRKFRNQLKEDYGEFYTIRGKRIGQISSSWTPELAMVVDGILKEPDPIQRSEAYTDNDISTELATIIEEMILQRDGLQNELNHLGLLNDEKYGESIGEYLNRSYQVFDDKRWRKKVVGAYEKAPSHLKGDTVYGRARNFLIRELRGKINSFFDPIVTSRDARELQIISDAKKVASKTPAEAKADRATLSKDNRKDKKRLNLNNDIINSFGALKKMALPLERDKVEAFLKKNKASKEMMFVFGATKNTIFTEADIDKILETKQKENEKVEARMEKRRATKRALSMIVDGHTSVTLDARKDFLERKSLLSREQQEKVEELERIDRLRNDKKYRERIEKEQKRLRKKHSKEGLTTAEDTRLQNVSYDLLKADDTTFDTSVTDLMREARTLKAKEVELIRNYQEQIDNIDGELERLLKRGEQDQYIWGSNDTGLAKNRDILKSRKDIPKEIRELWGEYHDPLINYGRTFSKAVTLIEKHKILLDIERLGKGTFLFLNPKKGFTASFSDRKKYEARKGQKDGVMSPLDKYFTSEEIRTAFSDIEKESEAYISNYFRAWMKGIAIVKYAKTIASVVTHVGNFTGNLFILGMNGYSLLKSPKQIRDAIKVLRDTKGEANQKYKENLIALGVIGDGVFSKELQQILREVNITDIDSLTDSALLRGLKTIGKKAEDLYQMEDDLFKIVAFENEIERESHILYDKKYEELTAAEKKIVDKAAADRVSQLFPTYSQAPKIVKEFRKNPLVASFATFTSEMIRTTYNWVMTIRQQVYKPRNERERIIGLKRLTGGLLTQLATIGIPILTRLMLGIDDEEMKALRRNVASWDKHGNIAILPNWFSKNKDEYRYINISARDPYGYFKDPFTALNIGGGGRAFWNEITEPYFSWEIFTKYMIEAAQGQKMESKKEIWVDTDTRFQKIKKGTQHVSAAFEPGTISTIKRIAKAVEAEPNDYGHKKDLGAELTALSGFRTSVIEPNRSSGFKISYHKKRVNEAKSLYNDIFIYYKSNGKFKDGVNPEKVYEEANRQYMKEMDEYSKLIRGNIEHLGADPKQLRDMVSNKKLYKQLLTGDIEPMPRKIEHIKWNEKKK